MTNISLNLEINECGRFVVDLTGRREEACSVLDWPAVQIIMREAIVKETRQVLYCPIEAHYFNDFGDRVVVHEDKEGEYKRERHAAFRFAYMQCLKHIVGQIALAVRLRDDPQLDIHDTFLRIFKDAGEHFLGQIERSSTEFRWLEPNELALCRRVFFDHFRDIYTYCNVLFRIRTDLDKDGFPKAWEAGRNARNEPVVKHGETKKLTDENRELYRQSIGYAPHFLITVSDYVWRGAKTEDGRMAIVHDLLCRCGWDDCKTKPFIVAPEIEAFGSTVLAFPYQYLPANRLVFVKDGVDAARRHQQLSLFGFEEEEDVTPGQVADNDDTRDADETEEDETDEETDTVPRHRATA